MESVRSGRVAEMFLVGLVRISAVCADFFIKKSDIKE